MQLVDTHCHIQSSDAVIVPEAERGTRGLWEKAGFPGGDKLISHAAEGGVTRMICVGCDVDDSQLAIDFVSGHKQCWASIGIHPHEAQRYAQNRSELERFAAMASADKIVAVGECGLDYFYEHSPREAQIEILRFQIELAQANDLPMIFHVRDALDDFWPVFDTYHANKPIRGVLHSFTDTERNLQKALDRGLYIGVNGIATFSKRPEQIAMYRAIPTTNLLFETDAPFLTPVPYRGTICEPYHISVTAEFLASLRGESLEHLATQTTQNALQLFGLV